VYTEREKERTHADTDAQIEREEECAGLVSAVSAGLVRAESTSTCTHLARFGETARPPHSYECMRLSATSV
jgi:hypothetical protein